MTSASVETTDDSYTLEMRLCDDKGLVSHEPVNEIKTLDQSYLKRHIRLQRMTQRGVEFLKAHPDIGSEPWTCTGHAHLAGAHIRCTSPAHSKIPVNQVLVGLSKVPPSSPNISRCPHCFQELIPMDIGYGDSTRLACPEHGWDRYPIISVPRWIERDIQQFPDLAKRYVEWLIDGAE